MDDRTLRAQKMGVRLSTVAAVFAGAALYSALPPTVIPLNDDFGSYRSVLETIAHHRPWTNDWLAPWSASLSVITAALFMMTGSLHTSIGAVLAFSSGVFVAGVSALMRSRGLGTVPSVGVALLIWTCPVVLWKAFEFTSVALCLPLLVWAIWAAEQRRWLLFAVLWSVAVASRQSAVAWLMLPAWAAVSAFRLRSPRTAWMGPAAVVAGGALVFAALTMTMNTTYAQRLVSQDFFQTLTPGRVVVTLALGAGIAVLSAGIGIATLASPRARNGRPGPSRFGHVIVAAILVAVFGLALRGLSVERPEHAGLFGMTYAGILGALGAIGARMHPAGLRWQYAAAAAVSVGLISLRPFVWDYYFLDAAVLMFLSALPAVPALRLRPAAIIVALVVAAFHAAAAVRMKVDVDRAHAATVLGEQALRAGRLDPTELAFAPFGFQGWHLHPHYVGHDGQQARENAGFSAYLRPSGVRMTSGQGDTAIGNGDVLASGVFQVGWFWHQRFTLVRSADGDQPPELPLDRTTYQRVSFPLTDAEWRRAAAQTLPTGIR